MDNVERFPSLLHHPLTSRQAQPLERTRQAGDQLLVRRLQDTVIGLGLAPTNFSIGGGGRIVHVLGGGVGGRRDPVRLDICTLPGRMPEDFTACSPAIGYNVLPGRQLAVLAGLGRDQSDLRTKSGLRLRRLRGCR